MKESTRKRKNASKGFRQLGGDEWVRNRLYRVLADGKLAFDAMMLRAEIVTRTGTGIEYQGKFLH